MNIFVTGAAGYIGSIVTEELLRDGYKVIAFDNLVQGHSQALSPKALFIRGDLANKRDLENVFRSQSVDAVVHLAADSIVEISVLNPRRYFQSNVVDGLNLLSCMLEYGITRIIFSSTAAVYGEPEIVPIAEGHPERPINAYGESKLMFERILSRFREAYGISFVSLRYFNAAGASQLYGEDHRPETHLIPKILKVALGLEEQIPIYGEDYDTEDGTCIRDYIHVLDIARAHVLSLKAIDQLGGRVFNLGNGRGWSVKQVINAASEVTGANIPILVKPRRTGDSARLVASYQQIRHELGWQPKFTELKEIINSAWKWQQQYPRGY